MQFFHSFRVRIRFAFVRLINPSLPRLCLKFVESKYTEIFESMWNVVLPLLVETFHIAISPWYLFLRRNGSVKADVQVIAVINANTTKEDEARDHLIDGIESALKERFDVTIIIVLGKSFINYSQINKFGLKNRFTFNTQSSERALQTVSWLYITCKRRF